MAASGIGLATAQALLYAGAKVVLIDKNKHALDAVCDGLGEAAIPLVLDLLDLASIADAIVYRLTRPRNVTIRDMVIIPSSFDL